MKSLVKFKKNFKIIILGLFLSLCYIVPCFAAPSEESITSGVGTLVDIGFLIFALLPGVRGAFLLVEGAQAYGEAKADGGNAQAAGKAGSSIVAGIILEGVAVLIFTAVKIGVKTMMGI